MAIFAAGVFSIQLIYWKYVSGEWVVYSYQDQGFSWLHPHVYDYTFSYISGWLRFSPMMILPVVGFFLYFKFGKERIAIIAFLLLDFYIVTAWDVWDYGATGGRAMVQAYPLLAFPFGVLIEKSSEKTCLKVPTYVLILLFAYFNIWWTYHAHAGNIQVTKLTRQYYWRMIGRWNGTDEDRKLLDNKYAYFGTINDRTIIYANDFESDSSQNAFVFEGNRKIKVNLDHKSTSIYTIDRPPFLKKWIRISADMHCVEKEWDIWKMAQFIVVFMDKDKEIQSNFIRIHRFISNGEDKNIYLDAKLPKGEWDRMEIQVWNAEGNKELWIDNLKVITFDG